MVSVGVSFKDIGQRQAEALEMLQVALPVTLHRIDNYGVHAVWLSQNEGKVEDSTSNN
jgi:hypothetical protein